jgi:hypothetical protein
MLSAPPAAAHDPGAHDEAIATVVFNGYIYAVDVSNHGTLVVHPDGKQEPFRIETPASLTFDEV